MDVRIYVAPGSHPSMTERLMVERKGVEYKRVDLIPAAHKPILRALLFEGSTVPALRVDGRRVQGTRQISRALDELFPAPPLFPADPARRAEVEEAERWGDEELQSLARRVAWWAVKRRPKDGRAYLAGARLGLPLAMAGVFVRPVAAIAAWANAAGDEPVRADLARLPGLLDEADALVERGVIGGDEPNAADYQIATSIALLDTLADVRPALEGRPCWAAALRTVPDFPGAVGPVFPAEWLEPLRRG